MPMFLCWRHSSRLNVDLNSVENESWCLKRFVTGLTHYDKFSFSDPVMHMNIVSAMIADCRLPCRRFARRGEIVMNGKQSRFGREREDLPDRKIKRQYIRTEEHTSELQ